VRVRWAHFVAFLVLSVFLVGAGPWRVDAAAMSGELQITSFCALQRMDTGILAAAHNGGSVRFAPDERRSRTVRRSVPPKETERRIRTFQAGEFSQRVDLPIAQFCSLVAGLSLARRVP
jgi:hypothetical protein